MRKRFRARLAAALLVGLLAQPLLVEPAMAERRTTANEFFTGLAALITTPVYGAFKLAFAFAGAIGGSFTWAFTGGDTPTAQRVWDTTMRGTYVLSPAELRGDTPIEFVGEPEPRRREHASAR